MKLLAFYASGLLMLCVMVFGNIEGFSFKLHFETQNFSVVERDMQTDQRQRPKDLIQDFNKNTSKEISPLKRSINL